MDRTSVSSSVTGLIREELQDETLVLRPDTELASIDGWDSVSMSCVVLAIERAFGFEFDGNELDSLTDLDSLITTVTRKQTVA